jgi:GNAT superfamily N-acetyltransferase
MADGFVGWVRDESTEPGFGFVVAVEYGIPVGFAYGYQQPVGKWWRGADQPAPAEVKTGPTLAVMEWRVLADRRCKGIGRALMDELLAGRTEPSATLTVNPAADARQRYERLGWQHVATTKPGRSSAWTSGCSSCLERRRAAACDLVDLGVGARPAGRADHEFAGRAVQRAELTVLASGHPTTKPAG